MLQSTDRTSLSLASRHTVINALYIKVLNVLFMTILAKIYLVLTVKIGLEFAKWTKVPMKISLHGV